MERFFFIVECIAAVLVAVPLLITVGGVCRALILVVWTFYDALAEEEALYPVPTTVEPARKMFAFDAGWRVIGYVAQLLPARVHESVLNWLEAYETVQYAAWSRPWLAPFAWLAMLGLQIAARIQYVIVALAALLFVAIHALLLTVWALALLLALGLVLPLRFCWNVLHYYFFPCPYCYQSIVRPVYTCPTCKAKHARLQPGLYGILTHRCRSCRHLLPTLDVLGRKRLERLCPSCQHPLSGAIGRGASVHIALVGAAAAGKTSFLVQAMAALSEKYREWYRLGLDDQEQEKHFKLAIDRLRHGRAMEAVTTTVPVPYVLHMQPSRLSMSRIIYLYDPIGKVFTASEFMSRQEYYRYAHGVLLCIDANALFSGGELPVMQTYEHMMELFEVFAGLRGGRRYRQAIAVVVTKVNQPQLSKELGSVARMALMQQDASISSQGEAMHQMVRAFLCAHGLDNLARDLESHFEHVRYFSCEALEGSAEKDGEALSVLEPLEWLLTRARAIPR
jgi:hypothetical protein